MDEAKRKELLKEVIKHYWCVEDLDGFVTYADLQWDMTADEMSKFLEENYDFIVQCAKKLDERIRAAVDDIIG